MKNLINIVKQSGSLTLIMEFQFSELRRVTSRKRQACQVTSFIRKFTNHLLGTQMQIQNSHYMLVFIQKCYPENFAFSILKSIELFTRNVCKIFAYRHTKTTEYVKISLLFKKNTKFTGKSPLRLKMRNFQGIILIYIRNTQGDLQICISVPVRQ